jgi:hypothetical protein
MEGSQKSKESQRDGRLEPVDRQHAQGEEQIRPQRAARQCADQQRGCEGGGDLDQSHLEALVDPDRTIVRCENDQCDHDEKKEKRPGVLGRCETSARDPLPCPAYQPIAALLHDLIGTHGEVEFLVFVIVGGDDTAGAQSTSAVSPSVPVCWQAIASSRA